MKHIDPNAPAYPGVDWISHDGKKNPQGMTIRAAMAMHLQAAIASGGGCTPEQAASLAIEYADALIAELNKEKP